MGIDFGTKKVGIALSDESGAMAFPNAVLSNANGPRLVQDVARIISDTGVEAIVIGESRDLQGGENAVAREARAFAESLEAQTHLPVFWEPEIFTTQEARRDFEGERTNKGVVDSSAAAIILNSFLDRTRGAVHDDAHGQTDTTDLPED